MIVLAGLNKRILLRLVGWQMLVQVMDREASLAGDLVKELIFRY